MSSLAPDNLLAAQKAGFDTSFGFAGRAVEGFEKLIDLNVQTYRATLAEQQEIISQALSARDPRAFLTLQTQYVQLNAERVQAYWQKVFEIASDVRGVYIEAFQDQFGKSQRNTQALVDSLASNAPAGSAAVVNAWKSALDVATQSANSAYEAARKSAQQVVEAAQDGANVASQTAVRAVPSKPVSAKK